MSWIADTYANTIAHTVSSQTAQTYRSLGCFWVQILEDSKLKGRNESHVNYEQWFPASPFPADH